MSTSANLHPLPTSSEMRSKYEIYSKAHPHEPTHLELCILTELVGLYRQPPPSDELANSAMTGPPNLTSTSILTGLIIGPLDSFLPYVGQEYSKWLIDVAHDICDPALKRGVLKVWDAAGEMWRGVNPTDPLTSSTYLYDTCDIVSLTKISERVGKSKTTATGNASTMANRVKQRDMQQCWVTRSGFQNINSHICPKRMGNHLLHIVYSAFVSTPPPTLSIYDEICGITLHPALDLAFDTYDFGLRCVAPDQYECHAFRQLTSGQQLTIAGYMPPHFSIPLLHGYRASPPQPQHPHNPPPGLIRWHYLQCVIRRFAHSDYRNLQNIFYCELQFRMEGDSDDEGTDSDYEWPSAALDRGRAMQMAVEHRETRERVVAEWVAAV